MNGLSVRFLRSILLMILAVAAVGCGKDKSCCPVEPSILPLMVGNQWLGVSTNYDSTGTVENVDTLAYVIVRDTAISGETWYVMTTDADTTDGPAKVGSLQLMTRRDDGIWVAAFGVPDFAPLLTYKFPAADGETFIRGSDSTTVQISAAEVTVPAGMYDCYCYANSTVWEMTGYSETELVTITDKVYLAPGIGYVKIEFFLQYDGRDEFLAQRWELLSTSFSP